MKKLSLLFLFAISQQCVSVGSVDIPQNDCPSIFQYLNEDNMFYGEITLFDLKVENISIDLRIQHHELINNDYYGDLILDADIFETDQNLKTGIPIVYRVDFPLQSELPKVLAITVNGIEICSGDGYPDFGSDVTLSHTFLLPNNSEFKHKTRPLTKDLPYENYKYNANDKKVRTTTVATTTTNDNYIYDVNAKVDTTTEAKTTTTIATTKKAEIESTQSISTAECGHVDTSTLALVYGGDELRRGQLPWLVPIYRKINGGTQFICGGSLLSSRTVLTAGHCFKLYSLRADQIVVYLGRHNLDSFSEDGVVIREVEKLVINPEYELKTFPDADLALMHLILPVKFSEYIKPICLWSEPDDDDSLIVGQIGLVAGWGADGLGRAVSVLPKMVNATIVSEVDCLKSEAVFSKLTSPRTLCAGQRDGTGPCLGDSGGGLMIKRGDRWMVRGIVSAGRQAKRDTCDLTKFVVYCDLAKHMSWLQSNLL